MSKYNLLGDYLLRRHDLKVSLTFEQVETIIKASLPASAFAHRAWWANTKSHPQACSWINVKWLVHEVNIKKREVTFVRPLFLTINKITHQGKTISLEVSITGEEIAMILKGPEGEGIEARSWSNIIQDWIDKTPHIFGARIDEPAHDIFPEMLAKLGYNVIDYGKERPWADTENWEDHIDTDDNDNLIWK